MLAAWRPGNRASSSAPMDGVVTAATKRQVPVTQAPRVIAASRRRAGLARALELAAEAMRLGDVIAAQPEGCDPRYLALLADLHGQCTAQAARIRRDPGSYRPWTFGEEVA